MTKIIQRHDTAANWTSINPVLAAGEMGIETDTNKFKFGDGVTTWSGLAYAAGEGGSTELVPATKDTLGGIKVGENLSITEDGTLSAGIEVFNKDSFNIIGSPTITEDGVASGFSTANYVQIPMPNLSTASTWTIQGKFSFGGALDTTEQSLFSSSASYRVIGMSICKGSTSTNIGKLGLNIGTSTAWIDAGNASSSLVLNNSYYFKLVFTGTSYQLFISEDGKSYTKEIDFESSVKLSYDAGYNFNLGINRDASIAPWLGTIDLSKFKIIADGVTIFDGLKYSIDSYTKAETDSLLSNKQDKLTAKLPLKIAEETVKELNNLTEYQTGGTLTEDFVYSLNSDMADGPGLVTVKSVPFSTANNWEIVFKTEITTATNALGKSIQQPYGFEFGRKYIALSTTGKIWDYVQNVESVTNSLVGQTLFMRYQFSGTKYIIGYSSNDITYTALATFNTSSKIKDQRIGICNFTSSTNYYNGKVYLADSYYKINGIKYPFVVIKEGALTISNNPATTSSLGVVQPDGTSITVSETGVISGQDVKTFTGYSDTGTLVLKSINGVLQWVAEG